MAHVARFEKRLWCWWSAFIFPRYRPPWDRWWHHRRPPSRLWWQRSLHPGLQIMPSSDRVPFSERPKQSVKSTQKSTVYCHRNMIIKIHNNTIVEFHAAQGYLQYIPRNMHTVFALLCFVVVIHWLIFPYPSGLLHWHCGNLTIAPVPAKQPWWIWINTSCEFIMNDCITTTKQSTTKPCAYFLGYTVAYHSTRCSVDMMTLAKRKHFPRY